MDIGKWAIANRNLIHFLIAVLVIGGALSYYAMSKLEDPEIKVKQAMVITTFPGASAHEVELQVTDMLEKSIRSMANINYVQSASQNDVSIITVELMTTVPDDEVEQYWDVLRRKVADVQSKMPEGANTSVVMDAFGDVYGMFYALTSDGFNDNELGKYAELIQREVQNINGISRVELYGERKECINIELLEDRMANLGVHPAEVLSTLKGQDKTIYSGYYEAGDKRLRVSVNDRYKNVEDIKSLLLQGHESDQLRLRDIANVYKSYENPSRNEMMYDGRQAIGISIAAQKGTDITKLGVKVDNLLTELKANRIPAGIDYHKVFFQPQRVNDALNTFLVNLLESVVIVILILMLSMGFRSGLIIGSSLLIIVLGSLVVLRMFDGTLQRVSLGAFILAMGMLVDNAIVIVDGILVDLKRNKPREEALTSIGRKTAMPLLGATLIAILAFLPIFLSPDTAGVYVRDLFVVLAVSLLLSWVLALAHVPIQCNRLLKVTPEKDGHDPFDTPAYRILRKILTWGLTHKTTSIVSAIVLVIVSAWLYGFLPQGFFPDMNYDQLYIEYKLGEGTDSKRVKSDLAAIESYLHSRKDVRHVTASVGATPSRYNLVRSIAMPSLSYGELIVDFISPQELVASMEEIQNHLSAQYPDAYVRLKRYNLMYKKYPIEAQFNGPDPEVLRQLTHQAEEIMRKNPKTFLVNNDWEAKVPTFMVDYNQPIARNIGLSRGDVGLSLLAATGGIPTASFYEGTRKQTVYLKCVDKDGNPIEALENAPIFALLPSLNGVLDKQTLQELMTGAVSESDVLSSLLQTVPLSQASNGVKVIWEEPVVVRYNGQRAMRAQANPAFGIGTEDARRAIATEIEAIALPEGYSLQWEGEYRASTQAKQYLFANFPLAVILMIAILIMLFKDYRKPMIIICSVPLLCVGVVLAVLVSGKTFGFVVITGVLGLIGMMIKNGVVLMDEITLQLESGIPPMKALLDSSSTRFRPVLMASMTTILGMIPLLPDDMFGPMAAAIMGGLLFGTIITLYFIPILYAVFFHIKIEKE